MRLLGKTVLIAAIASTAACHDSSGPHQPVNYVLSSIDGRPLPTFISPVPESPTVLSGTFFLDGAGHATAFELRRDMSGNEYSLTVSYRYTITGNVIRFAYDPPCGGPAIDCIAPPNGTIFDSQLLIDFSGGHNTPIYDYQVGGEIE
jgi:hypothetical protein